MLAPLVLLAALREAPSASNPSAEPTPAPRPRIELADPAPVPRTAVKERPRRPFYGEARPLRYFGVRLGLGLGFRVAGPPADRAHFALDLLPTARVGLHRGDLQTALVPTLGYSLGAGKVTREHFFLAGLGLGVTSEDGTLALIPAVLVGAAERSRVLGLRTALLLDLRRKGFTFELAHQALWLAAGVRHELRLVVGVDLRKLFVGKRE